MCFKTKALRLKWDRTASSKRIEYRGQRTSIALANLLTSLSQKRLVVAVLPDDELLHQGVEPRALGVLGSDRGELLWPR